jgi:hypothetical protein
MPLHTFLRRTLCGSFLGPAVLKEISFYQYHFIAVQKRIGLRRSVDGDSLELWWSQMAVRLWPLGSVRQ